MTIRDLYPTKHITHKTQTSMPEAGFEPAITTNERTQIHAFDRAVNVNGEMPSCMIKILQQILYHFVPKYCTI